MKNLLKNFLPANKQGIFIDVLVILLNLLLFPFLTSRIAVLFDLSFRDDSAAFKTLAVLMLLILFGRLFGLYLKRFPLQTRLEKPENADFPKYFLIFNIPLFILTAAFSALIIAAILGSFGIVETNYDGSPKDSPLLSWIIIPMMLILTGTEILLLYRLSKPLTKTEKEETNWKNNFKSELLADFGLFAYMVVWQVFYNYTISVLLTMPGNADQNFTMKTIGIVFSFIVFLIFYLSPRTVFLIEDYRHTATWLSILLVFLASIVWYL